MVTFRAICFIHCSVGMGGDRCDLHLSALEMDEEEHVVGHQASPREDLHCEKVSSHQRREVSRNEFRPLVVRLRSGARGMPWCSRTLPTV